MRLSALIIFLLFISFSAVRNEPTNALPVRYEPKPVSALDYISDNDKEKILKKVNRIRKNGCFCGRRYMEPTKEVVWNDVLYKSAMGHAKEMTRYNFFAHFSIDGSDIGDRLEDHGYDWQVAGENLGEGQKSFDEVLVDWLESRSHCKMLMNPKVNEMAVATHGRFWVQHFGKKMPKKYHKTGAKRTNYE